MQELTLASFPKASTLLDLAATRARGRDRRRARGDTDESIAQLGRGGDPGRPGLHRAAGVVLPVRHNLGAVLLDAAGFVEAEAVYREDLRQFPENGWSLFGLYNSLAGQQRTR